MSFESLDMAMDHRRTDGMIADLRRAETMNEIFPQWYGRMSEAWPDVLLFFLAKHFGSPNPAPC